jgi:hypothetical protein
MASDAHGGPLMAAILSRGRQCRKSPGGCPNRSRWNLCVRFCKAPYRDGSTCPAMPRSSGSPVCSTTGRRTIANLADDRDDELLQQEEAALETLAVVLPQQRTKIRSELEFFRAAKWSGNLVVAKEKRLREIETLLQSVNSAWQSTFWNRFWGQHNVVADQRKWRELQDALCQDFVAAMKPNNPDETFGLSETGVLARFIAAVTPMITGETIKPSSVGQHRKRAARK